MDDWGTSTEGSGVDISSICSGAEAVCGVANPLAAGVVPVGSICGHIASDMLEGNAANAVGIALNVGSRALVIDLGMASSLSVTGFNCLEYLSWILIFPKWLLYESSLIFLLVFNSSCTNWSLLAGSVI